MIHLISEIVRRAGNAARDTRAALRDGMTVSEKQLVAAGECAAERVLRRRLLALHRAAWISPGNPTIESSDDAWVVAPLNGPRAYATFAQRYGVAAGLVRSGELVVSAMYFPDTGTFYRAERGSGAWDERGNRLIVSSAGAAVAYTRDTSFALSLADIATGAVSAVASPECIPTWEFASGMLLVTEAGGVVLNGQRDPIRLAPPYRGAHPIVAGAPDAVHKLLSHTRTDDLRGLHTCNA